MIRKNTLPLFERHSGREEFRGGQYLSTGLRAFYASAWITTLTMINFNGDGVSYRVISRTTHKPLSHIFFTLRRVVYLLAISASIDFFSGRQMLRFGGGCETANFCMLIHRRYRDRAYVQ